MSSSIRMKDSTEPSTPSTGYTEFYVDGADSHIKVKDDAGTVFDLQTASAAITALTGDVTATGPGSAAATLATVNANVGTFGTASSVATVTLNAKGLATAASNTSIQIAESQVTNLVTDLAGKQPTGNYITDLTGDVTATGPGSVAATIANLAVTNAKIANSTIDLTTKVTGVLPVANGGTNSSTALSNNRVMQSSTGSIVEAAAITAARALISDANGIPTHSTTTSTELGYVSGVTSAIQTQINSKANPFTIVAVSSDVTLTANAIHLVSSAAARNLTLPAHVAGQRLYIKDSTGSCETNNFTVIRTGGGNIDGLAASRTLEANWGSWHFVDDGTDWFIV